MAHSVTNKFFKNQIMMTGKMMTNWQELHNFGWRIISTGCTSQRKRAAIHHSDCMHLHRERLRAWVAWRGLEQQVGVRTCNGRCVDDGGRHWWCGDYSYEFKTKSNTLQKGHSITSMNNETGLKVKCLFSGGDAMTRFQSMWNAYVFLCLSLFCV